MRYMVYTYEKEESLRTIIIHSDTLEEAMDNPDFDDLGSWFVGPGVELEFRGLVDVIGDGAFMLSHVMEGE